MEHKDITEGEHSPKEIAKFIAIIVSVIIISLLAAAAFGGLGLENWLRWFMGVFFVVFSGFKFAGYKMFAMMFAGYDIVAKRFMAYAYAYPFIELALGLLYVFDLIPVPRDAATLVIMGTGTIGVAQEIKKRSGVHCACLGNIVKLPLSTVSLVEDAGMGIMALAMLILR